MISTALDSPWAPLSKTRPFLDGPTGGTRPSASGSPTLRRFASLESKSSHAVLIVISSRFDAKKALKNELEKNSKKFEVASRGGLGGRIFKNFLGRFFDTRRKRIKFYVD